MVGIITTLDKEYVAMCAMLDQAQDYIAPGDGAGRRYVRGTVPAASAGRHSVVVALSLDMGNNASAIRTSRMLDHFPRMKHVLMVGIAGGVPSPAKPEDHVRLGDVVVSDRSGVVQYDLGKEHIDAATEQSAFIIRTPPRPPSAELLEAARLMRAGELRGERAWLKWVERAKDLPNSQRPPTDKDELYDTVDQARRLEHPIDPLRLPAQSVPRVFLGTIASANRVLKNPILRDSLRQQYGVKAIEMEGSGVADATWQLERSYLVVRGICDYCDTHKNDIWQEYAAAVAAAYTRGLLGTIVAEVEQPNPSSTVFEQHGGTLRSAIGQPGSPFIYASVVRELLTTAFSDEELTTLCFDYFLTVYNNFSSGLTKGQKIQNLLDYCTRHESMDKLLDVIKTLNPVQYRHFESRLGA